MRLFLFGTDNTYNLPSLDILNRLENQASIEETYRTDEGGTIWITSNGNEINIEWLDYNLDGKGRKVSYLFERKFVPSFFAISELFSISYNMI